MKVKVKATVVFEWEEDSANWGDDNPQTVDDLLKLANDYAKDDPSYILGCEPTSIGLIEIAQ